MKIHRVGQLCVMTALAVFGSDKIMAAQPGPNEGEGVQVLTRGPVHEAFAETVSFDPQPGIVAPKPPPELIEEVPPDERPEGANVTWIPGYWAWDDDQHDYLWVSGIWRALPPGRQWVTGYWSRTEQGFQWTSGYWADAVESETEYLPPPPETVEVGPNIDAPSANVIWVPGTWVWHHGHYAWRPGFWMEVRQDWVWVPAHFIWTLRGYVFSDGYWDYSIDHRGILFAPVVFDTAVYARHGFVYTPTVVINIGIFSDQLFVRPRYNHYYFGDYYATSYADAGIYPAFSAYSRHYAYDPIYAHESWEHRSDRDWKHHVESEFEHRRDHEEARPPRTWASQMKHGTDTDKSREKNLVVGSSFDQLAKRKDNPMRFQSVDKAERQNLVQRGQEFRKFRDERQTLETKAAITPPDKLLKDAEPPKVKISRSPIVSRSADQFGKDQAPPKRPSVPNPDLKIEPKKRDKDKEDKHKEK